MNTMKKIAFVFLTVLAFQSFAQDYSTINFVTNKCSKDWKYEIYLNDKFVSDINFDENLEYKIYSEGRVTVTIFVYYNRFSKTIEITNGNTYYFEISDKDKKYDFIDESTAKQYLAKNPTMRKFDENKTDPIVKLRESDSDGPKQGTCFLVSKDGYLLTNYHVISGAKKIQIKGIGNDFSTIYAADVVGYDLDLDLALLKLKNQNIVFDDIPYGFSTKTNQQGESSFVLGYPLTTAMGEEIKVTEGVISAKSGYKGTISQYQFSAAVQPGNSGSPLFNGNGEVIGVINAKLQGVEAAGYAIKSQYALTFLELIENVQITNNKTAISEMSLSEKISKLKNFIFIVITE